MNNFVCVGRLTAEPKIIELENDKKVYNITLKVTRPFKNGDGIYETDIIPFVLSDGIANTIKEYCKKGDFIGVRGRIQANNGIPELVGEKITFLSSKKVEEN